jgi:membrane fusion protein, copper/silver efflux system
MVNSDPPNAAEPNRKGFGLGALLAAALLGAIVSGTAVLVAVRGSGGSAAAEASHAAHKYHCPMHPAVVQDHPGDCPICGMKLVEVSESAVPAPVQPATAGQRRIVFYRSPMDPKQTSPVPRKDEMGMDYLPVYDDEVPPPSPVAGLASVEIDPERQQLIGLKTAEVSRGPIGGAWRSVGRVAIDETRVGHVNIKVGGFVERIFVDFVGKRVRRGDPLFSMYSPELFAAQEEYLLALRSGALGGGDGGNILLDAARKKLALWDISRAELERLERTKQSNKTVTFRSPLSGVVTKKDVVTGMKLDAGAMPYEIVDLSSVWVLVDVYESELRHVKEGMHATLKLDAFPNREFSGKVAFVDPMLDPRTRTIKVRLSFQNPTGELKPEMFGEAVLMSNPHDALVVPLDAVIDSGIEKIVFVASGEGKFEARSVRLGESDGNRVEVESGLSLGERVVIRANFLVDSESRLRASLTAGAHDPAPESARVMQPPLPPDAPSAEPKAVLPAPTPPVAPEAAPRPQHQHGAP